MNAFSKKSSLYKRDGLIDLMTLYEARGGFELILTLAKTLEILIERDLAHLTILRCNKSVTETTKIPSVRQILIYLYTKKRLYISKFITFFTHYIYIEKNTIKISIKPKRTRVF